jgi:hypothetical protein
MGNFLCPYLSVCWHTTSLRFLALKGASPRKIVSLDTFAGFELDGVLHHLKSKNERTKTSIGKPKAVMKNVAIPTGLPQ